MDGDGSFDPADLLPLLEEVRRGPRRPRGRPAATGRAAACGRGTPAPATRWSSGGCAAGSGCRCTTSRRCGSAAATPCSTSTCEDRRFGYPVELLQKAHARRLAVRRARRRLPPARRGHPVQGVRLRAGHAAHRPRLRQGAVVRPPVRCWWCQGAGRRPGEDPARRATSAMDRGRRPRRRRAPRHARGLSPRRSARALPRSRSTATWPAPSRGGELLAAAGRLDRAPAARRRLRRAARQRPRSTWPGRRRARRADRHGHPAADGRRPAAVAAAVGAGNDAVLGPADDGGWWVLALHRPGAAAAAGRRADVHRTGRRRHAGRPAAARARPSRRPAVLRDVDDGHATPTVAAAARRAPGSRRCGGPSATACRGDRPGGGATRRSRCRSSRPRCAGSRARCTA